MRSITSCFTVVVGVFSFARVCLFPVYKEAGDAFGLPLANGMMFNGFVNHGAAVMTVARAHLLRQSAGPERRCAVVVVAVASSCPFCPSTRLRPV
jgi:hypothetical protein